MRSLRLVWSWDDVALMRGFRVRYLISQMEKQLDREKFGMTAAQRDIAEDAERFPGVDLPGDDQDKEKKENTK